MKFKNGTDLLFIIYMNISRFNSIESEIYFYKNEINIFIVTCDLFSICILFFFFLNILNIFV